MDQFGLSGTNARAARPVCVGLALCALAAAFGPSPARAEATGKTAFADGESMIAGGESLLGEDQVARFAASLAEMHRLGLGVARGLRMGEFNPDDPLAPYAMLVERAEVPEPEIASVLVENGFTTLAEWLRIGRSVMPAYWAREEEATQLGLAVQLAPIVFAVRGRGNPSAEEVSNLIDRLKADMTARSAQYAPPPANLRLVGKYHGKIGEALRPRP